MAKRKRTNNDLQHILVICDSDMIKEELKDTKGVRHHNGQKNKAQKDKRWSAK